MDSELYNAVITDKVDVLKKMKGRLRVCDQVTHTKDTVLHLACQYGSIKCVEEILGEHAEVLLLSTNLRGETALHLAARHGRYDVAVVLIDAAKLFVSQPDNLPDTTPSTVMMPQNLIESTDVEVLKPLTDEEEKQKSMQSKSTDQRVADEPTVHAAAPSSSSKQVITEKVVPNLTNVIRSTDLEGETALHQAVRYNRGEVVRLLVQHDQGHSYPQNKRHETPLYLASIRHYDDIISTILYNCKSPRFDGPDGRTALHAAVLASGGSECVKLLFSKGNTNLVEVQDEYGWTAFHFVAYNNLHTIVKDLVYAEDKCEGYRSVGCKSDKKGRMALHVAAYKGAVDVMAELVKYYPDSWEIVDGSGRNVLHIALARRQVKVISFIFSQGGKTRNINLLSQRDNEGNTPLHVFAKSPFYVPELTTRWKFDFKIDWEVTDNNNLTPLDVIQCRRKTDTLGHAERAYRASRRLEVAGVTNHKKLWSIQKMSDLEMGEEVRKNYNQVGELLVNRIKDGVNTHMIVAALIATVALTAGFAVPGGFVEDKGSTQGTPNLLRKAAFKAFMITDTITVLSSVSSLFLYFASTADRRIRVLIHLVVYSGLLNVFSLITMMLTFGTGTYAVLAPSSSLAISVFVLSSLFPLYVLIHFRHIILGYIGSFFHLRSNNTD